MATSTAPYQCPSCLNRYSRHEHLQRHLVSHGSNNPFTCEFCPSSFKRGDVLRRHLRSCKRRIRHDPGLEGVAELATPSRRRACDRCVRQKRACNFSNPCEGCTGRGVPCIYSRVQQATKPSLPEPVWDKTDGSSVISPSDIAVEAADIDFAISSLTWQDFYTFQTQPIHSQFQLQSLQPQNPLGSIRLLFLAKLTSTTGFVSSFDCGPLNIRRLVAQNIEVEGYEDDSEIHEIEDICGSYFPEEGTGEDSAVTLEDIPHIWGYILPGHNSPHDQDLQFQQKPQISPQFTPNWIQNRRLPMFAESISRITCSGPSQDLKIDLSHHKPWLSDPLALKTHEIVSRIKEAVCLKARNSIIVLTWSALLEEICLQFFSPPNLRKFLGLYWACWHPNWPVIHKPTFYSLSAQPTLLTAMVLIGACVSPDRLDLENARIWLDSVEEMTFGDDVFCADNFIVEFASQMTLKPSKCRPKVQALQAAYAVCLYQNWEGPDSSKCRIRRYRYSTLVAIARDLGLGSGNYETADSENLSRLEWSDFSIREEFIRSVGALTFAFGTSRSIYILRMSILTTVFTAITDSRVSSTSIYIFLLDTAFIVFNNHPPRLVVKELKTDMACPESCFQASSAEEYFAEVKAWRSSKRSTRKMSLCSAIEKICKKDLDWDTCEVFADLGVLNLFTIVSAIHSLLFQYQTTFGYEPQLMPIRNALTNWEEIWILRASSTAPEEDPFVDVEESSENLDSRDIWKRVGFMRNAPEYWLLAKIVLDRLESARNENNNADVDFDMTGNRCGNSNLSSSVLDKYDETSMSQVNALITDFQLLNM